MATLGEYIPNANTKGYWKLNGNSTDSSGNGNNGTDTAITYSQANGRFGQGAGFNGSSSKIDVGNNINLTGNFTINVFAKPTSTISSLQRLVIRELNGLNYPQYGFSVEATNKVVGEVFSNNSGAGASVTSIGTLAVSSFNMISFIRDGSTIKLYLNGKLDNSTNWSSAQKASTDTTTIGSSKNSGGTTINIFNGGIDEVIIEDAAWSAEKVKKYYTMARGRYACL